MEFRLLGPGFRDLVSRSTELDNLPEADQLRDQLSTVDAMEA